MLSLTDRDLLIFVGMLAVPLAPTGIGWTFYEWRWFYPLRKHGLSAKGLITATRVDKGRETFFYVTYQFDTQEASYTREQRVSGWNYEQLKVGTSIRIQYLPQNPNISRLGGIHRDNIDRNRTLLFLFVYSLGLEWIILLITRVL